MPARPSAANDNRVELVTACGRGRRGSQSEFSIDIDNVDELVVDELFDAEAKPLAALAGVADTAKRQIGLHHRQMVDENHAGLNLPGHFRAVLGIGGKHRATQQYAWRREAGASSVWTLPGSR
jgi:hypothetical protein